MSKRTKSPNSTSRTEIIPSTRKARVILPETIADRYSKYVVLYPPYEFPEPHRTVYNGVTSEVKRRHHRIYVPQEPYRNTVGVEKIVEIPIVEREFEPFQSSYQFQDGFYILHRRDPAPQVDRQMNRRQRDWKHHSRGTRDDSRADAFRMIHPKNPHFGSIAFTALSTGSVGMAADSFLAARHILERT